MGAVRTMTLSEDRNLHIMHLEVQEKCLLLCRYGTFVDSIVRQAQCGALLLRRFLTFGFGVQLSVRRAKNDSLPQESPRLVHRVEYAIRVLWTIRGLNDLLEHKRSMSASPKPPGHCDMPAQRNLECLEVAPW